MKPILILQHLDGDGPAYLGQWLGQRGIGFEVRNQQSGALPPATLDGFGALAILGGEMGANDDLPALRGAEHLVREALREGVPTLGHCLGGQLMARALGGTVAVAPVPEIGWQPMQVLPGPEAQAWFGPQPGHTVFQWHYDSFTLPPGSTLLARSAVCPQQAFAIGPHLAMQFHIELDIDKLTRWSYEDSPLYRAAQQSPASVQTGAAMREGAALHLQAHQALADRVYTRWLMAAAGC